MPLPSLKGLGVQQEPDFNKALDTGHAPYADKVPKQLLNTVFQMESSGGTNRANEKLDLGKYGWLTGHTTTGSAANTIANLKKNPKLDYKVKNTPGWDDLSTPESAFGHTASALAMAIRDNPGMSLEDVYFKKYVTAKQSDTPARRAQFRKLMGTGSPKITIPKNYLPTPTQSNVAVPESNLAVDTIKGIPETVWNLSKKLTDLLVDRVKKIPENLDKQFNPTGILTSEGGELKLNKEKVDQISVNVLGFTGGASGSIKKTTKEMLPKIEQFIAKETDSAMIKKALQFMGHPTDKIDEVAETLSKTKTVDEVKKVLSSSMTETASKEAILAQKTIPEVVQPGLAPEAPLPQSNIPQQVSEGVSSPVSMTPQPVKAIGEEVSGAISRLRQAISTARPARAELETAYTAERSKRAAGLQAIQQNGAQGKEGYIQQLKSLEGELASIEKKQFEMKTKMIEEDVNSLFKAAKLNPTLDVYEKLNTQTALVKILDGVIPTNSELSLLERTFGKDLVQDVLKQRTTGQKLLEGFQQMINLPRSVMSSVDLSAPFRQGLALISHPKAFGNAFVGMFKQFGSEKAFKAVQESIAQMPEYQLMKRGKLALTDVGTMMTNREEQFMSSWAEKIPLLGKGVKASNRAYVGFLNKLRADTFTDIIKGVRATGKELDTKLIEEIADFVNTASGRGSKILGVPIGNAGTVLNGLFFSPRLMASRLTLLNPVSYVAASPVVRKEMFKSLFSVLGAGSTVLGLAKMSGAEVGTDPTSSDFGKIKIGNTRMDIWGGFQQYVRMAAQIGTGKYTSTTGKITPLGEGYRPLTRYDIALRQIESKEAPILSFITALLKQQDYQGKPVNVRAEIGKRFVPMVIGDLYNIAKENPELLPAGLLAVFGVGIQSYKPPTYSKTTKNNPLKQNSSGLNNLKGLGM